MAPGSAERCPATIAATASGAKRGGDQGGRRGDHAVEDHRHPARGGAEDEAGQRGVLQAADRGQHAERVGRVGAVPARAPRSTTSILWASVASSMPVPRPVTAAGAGR